MAKQSFSKISEWVSAGAMKTGLQTFEKVERETAKAVSFAAKKFNNAGNLYESAVWFPKSQVIKVENDFYESGPKTMYLVPNWLVQAKIDEGYEI